MRIAIADDVVLVREGLAALLAGTGMTVTAQAGTGDEILDAVADDPPDVVILDIRMPPTYTDEGLVAAEALRRDHPDLGILVLSQYSLPSVAQRLLAKFPARFGYLLKERIMGADELLDALRRIVAGEVVLDPSLVGALMATQQLGPLSRLTTRECEVLRCMAEGRSNRGIAELLAVSPNTVEVYVARIFTKLGLSTGFADNRRVLAVLEYLSEMPAGHGTAATGSGGPGG